MRDAFHSNRKLHILLITGGCVIAAMVYALLIRAGLGLPCLLHEITGLLCPGCGNSRAALALLRLDIRAALEYNLLFPLEFGYIAWAYFRCCREYQKGGRFTYCPPLPWIDAMILIVIVLWGILRNFL